MCSVLINSVLFNLYVFGSNLYNMICSIGASLAPHLRIHQHDLSEHEHSGDLQGVLRAHLHHLRHRHGHHHPFYGRDDRQDADQGGLERKFSNIQYVSLCTVMHG